LWVESFIKDLEKIWYLTQQPVPVPESHGTEAHQEQQQEETTHSATGFQERLDPPEEKQQTEQHFDFESLRVLEDLVEEFRLLGAFLIEKKRQTRQLIAFLDEREAEHVSGQER
jgi:hypothetical protein